MYDICCIGHITLDKVITPQYERHMPGGTAWYFSWAIHQMPVTYMLLTAVGKSELASVDELRTKGIAVSALPSTHSIYFENRYSDNPDDRTQRVLQQADPFTTEDVTSVAARIYHLGPLLSGDISPGTIQALAPKGRVSLDAQGYVRKVADQQVLATDWKDKREVLPYVHFLKVNEYELEALTGTADISTGAQLLAKWGVQEVIVTLGSKGAVILAESNFYRIPAFKPAQIIDATGCGDTFMAGYLFRRIKGDGIRPAGEFAAAMAALKLAKAGPFHGTEEEVRGSLSR